MARNVLVELVKTAGGVGAALAMTAAAAWAYPLGIEVIWGCGVFAMVAIVLMGIAPLRRAAARDSGGRV